LSSFSVASWRAATIEGERVRTEIRVCRSNVIVLSLEQVDLRREFSAGFEHRRISDRVGTIAEAAIGLIPWIVARRRLTAIRLVRPHKTPLPI
jgi:hypothetical protein